jgi:hypothetical protein
MVLFLVHGVVLAPNHIRITKVPTKLNGHCYIMACSVSSS